MLTTRAAAGDAPAFPSWSGRITFAPGVEVTEIDQVKGLEFDYVIAEVIMTHFPERPGARRLLHVGATRAIHQLWLTSVGTPTAWSAI